MQELGVIMQLGDLRQDGNVDELGEQSSKEMKGNILILYLLRQLFQEHPRGTMDRSLPCWYQ